MDIKELREIYDKKKEVYKQLEMEAKYILEDSLMEEGMKYDRLESRIKKFDSFEKKIERKEFKSLEEVEKITDFLGIRVICLFLSDLKRLGEIIDREFSVVSKDDKLEDEEVDKFGYQSIHYIVKLKDNCTGRRYDKIKDYDFEIQVRTLAMHSWANISHHLSYKNEDAVPKELQRDFHALSALLHVVDKTFESIYKESSKNMVELSEVKEEVKLLEMPLNLDTLRAYCNLKFKERGKAGDEVYSELIQELKRIGVTSIQIIDEAVNISLEAALVEEEDYSLLMGESGGEMKYSDVGIIRGVFDLISEDYRSERDKSVERYLDMLDKEKLESYKKKNSIN